MFELGDHTATLWPVNEAELAALNWKRLGERLRAAREALDLTLQDVAAAAGVSISTVENYESGRVPKKQFPRQLGKVTRALGWAPQSEMEVLRGGEPTPLQPDSESGAEESDLVFILRHVANAGPRTLRAMRAVLEADLHAPR